MSRPGPGGGAARWRRPAVFWTGLVALLVVGVALVGPPAESDEPLDPRSGRPLGTLGLVLLLESLGADVDRAALPGDDHDVALVLADELDERGRERVEAWVEAGGTLVVAGLGSELLPFAVEGPVLDDPFAETLPPGACDLDALADVGPVDPAGGAALRLTPSAAGCYEGGGGAFVAAVARGDGVVVGIGGAGALVNDRIGEASNAALAAALLAPEPGTAVAVLPTEPVGAGDATLGDLVSDRVVLALVQLGVAFVLYALWRGRRLGRPVAEEPPVRLAASELVVAVGNLLHEADRRDAAAAVVADDLRRTLATRLGLGPEASPDEVARVASARTGIADERFRAVLSPPPPAGADDLVALAEASESVRQEVARAR